MSTLPVRGHRGRLVALSLAMLLPSLGTSIANVALPSLSQHFAAPFRDVQWVVIAYLLTVTSLVVVAGRLGDMLGRRRLLLVGIAVFGLASGAAVLSPSLWVLVALRAIQGLGAAIMMALTVASVGDLVPRERTGSAMGLLGTVSAVGTALGPSLGGMLVAAFGWQAVFATMAGAAAVTFGVTRFLLPIGAPSERKQQSLDIPATLLLGVSLAAYCLTTTFAGTAGTLVNATCTVVAIVGLTGFVLVEWRAPAPLVQLRLLRDRTLSAGLVTTSLISAIVMASLVVGPFYLSQVLRLSPVDMGLVMSVGPAVAALTGIPAGRLVDRFGPSALSICGLSGVATGSLAMVLSAVDLGVLGYGCSLAVITAGYALFQAATNTAVMNHASKTQRGVISALLALARNLGLISGASAMGALFAFGSAGLPTLGLVAGGRSGLQLTFAVAAGLAAVALALTRWGLEEHRPDP